MNLINTILKFFGVQTNSRKSPDKSAEIYHEDGSFAGYGCNRLTTPPDVSEWTQVTNAEDDPVIMEIARWTRQDFLGHRAGSKGIPQRTKGE